MLIDVYNVILGAFPLHNNIYSKKYTGACTSSLRTCIYHSYGDVFNEEGVFSVLQQGQTQDAFFFFKERLVRE